MSQIKMNYSDLKKLDEETLEKLTEGLCPCDKCLCSILAPPEGERRGFRLSIKKAFASIGQRRLEKKRISAQLGRHGEENALESDSPAHNTVEIPLTYTKEGKGIYTTSEAEEIPFCGECRCEYENIVLRHSYANIRITSPDISSICPCSSDCLSGHRRLEKKRIRTQLGRHGLENALKSDSPGHNTVKIPLTYTKGGKGIYTTREAVKAPFCGKCRCEYENIVLKHSYANIRITSPDISSICPCPNDCLPGKGKLKNNIKVTIERVAVDSHAAGIPEFDSQYSCEDLAQSSLDTIPQSEYSNSLEHQDHNTN